MRSPLSPETDARKATVGDIVLGHVTPRIDARASADDALSLMYQFKTQAVAVMDGQQLVGVLTYADYLDHVARPGLDARTTPVHDAMSPVKTPAAAPGQTCRDVFETVCQNGLTHIPVTHDGRFLGLVSDDQLRREMTRELHMVGKKSPHPILSFLHGHGPVERAM